MIHSLGGLATWRDLEGFATGFGAQLEALKAALQDAVESSTVEIEAAAAAVAAVAAAAALPMQQPQLVMPQEVADAAAERVAGRLAAELKDLQRLVGERLGTAAGTAGLGVQVSDCLARDQAEEPAEAGH